MNCKKKTPGNVNNREKAQHKSGLLMCRHTCEDMSGFSFSTSAGCGGRSRASYRKSQKQERQKKGMKWICVINHRKKSPQNVSEVSVSVGLTNKLTAAISDMKKLNSLFFSDVKEVF